MNSFNRVKPVFKCVPAYKENFKDSQCALTISVGQKVHEGDTFAATVDLAGKSFHSCIILLDDTLQRHTMALNTNESGEFFYETAFNEGSLWLERNHSIYSTLPNLKEIIRWDAWLKHPGYLEEKESIEAVIAKDQGYKFAFEETISEFLRRYLPRLNNKIDFDVEKARRHCLDYLIEECAIMCLRIKMGLSCHFDIYPSQRNFAMSETHRKFVLTAHPDLLLPVAVKFKNRTTLYPQQFQLLSDKITVAS